MDLAAIIPEVFEQGAAAPRDVARAAVIVKCRDERTDARTELERWIR